MADSTCEICGGNLLPTDKGLFCYPCQKFYPGTETKLSGLDRGRQEILIAEAEARIVAHIVRGLGLRGYTIMEIGQRNAKQSGTTVGAPDLFVTRAKSNGYVGLEVKRPGYCPSDVSPAQQLFADRGEIVIVTSLPEALAVLEND